MKIKSKLFTAFSITIGLAIILGIITIVSVDQINSQFEFLIEHDLNVLQNAQKLQKLVVDAETGQRGFVITGEESFLEPYYSGVNGFDELIEIEKELVSDNPPQVEKLETIQVLFEDWKTKAAIPEIELARTVHQSTVSTRNLETLLSEGVGKGILDEIRVNLGTLIQNLDVANNLEAELLVLSIAKDVVDRETGQRGFLITGKDEFLEPYEKGAENFEIDVAKLKIMLADDPENLQLVNNIVSLENEWVEKAAIPEIELARAVHQSDITARDLVSILSEGVGKGILDEIRVNLGTLIQNLDVANNLEAELLVLSIAKDVVDRETGQRGFLITGKDEFLEPYEKGAENFEIDVAKLKIMLADDPENLQLVNNIVSLENEWVEKAAIPEIDARKKVDAHLDSNDLADLLLAGTGKGILDQIRIEFDDFTQIENELKDKRFETVSTIEFYTQNGVLVFTIFIIIVGILVLISLLRSVSTPIRKLKDGSEKMGKGEYLQLEVSGNDEISDLTRSFNSTIDNILQSKIAVEESIDSEKRQNKLDAEVHELKKSDILKEEFASMVAHELKTPLTPIRGYCEMLLDESFGTLTEDQKDYVKKIDSSAFSLQRLVGDLLDTQKLDMKKMHFNIQSLDVDEFLDKLEQDSTHLMKDKGIEFVRPNPLKISIETDELRLRQIFDNMIKNSVDFVPSTDGRIEVGAKQENGEMIFYVKDNGDGIPKEKQKGIFKKFYQADTSHTRSHGGTGLGLVICMGLVEGLGGKIWFESELGKGTTFYFSISIHKEKNNGLARNEPT